MKLIKQLPIFDSTYEHYKGGLAKYRTKLLTFGDHYANLKTEIMESSQDGNFTWSVVDTDFPYTNGELMMEYSLVTVETAAVNDEYVLLIGGLKGAYWPEKLKSVYKFNGTWVPFGQLQYARFGHRSLFWRDAVYVFGGQYNLTLSGETYANFFDGYANTEVWNLKIFPEHFNTSKQLPQLYEWRHPHLFVIPSTYFI